MTNSRPSETNLAGLPLRSIVAYAYRSALRALARSEVPHAAECGRVLELVRRFVESSCDAADQARQIGQAAAAVVGAEITHEPEDIGVGLAVRSAGMCSCYAAEAMDDQGTVAEARVRRAATAAARAARQMTDADRRYAAADFERLIELYGKRQGVTLGPAFDPSESGVLGPLH